VRGADELVFIHIHKTAGESIMASLRADLGPSNLSHPQGRSRGIIIDAGGQEGPPGGTPPIDIDRLRKHSTALEVRDVLSTEVWDRYFTFSFVRHPIDRALSVYRFVANAARRPNLSVSQRVRRRLSPPARKDPSQWLGVRAFAETDSFSEFLRHPFLDEALGARSQSASLCDAEGNVIVDFVGRFERLDEDFGYVQQRLGLPVRALPWENRSRQDDGTAHTDVSAEDRAFLAAKYSDDFRRFGYEP
jgi:hypothetical protein